MDPSEVCILVVEDDEFTRIATAEILVSCGYSVESVIDGREALNCLLNNEGKFDLILCDMMLPNMNGIELLEALSLENKLSHIPVVMTSSNEEMDIVTACLSKGAKDYLIKPIQLNTAKTLVRHVWLSRRREMGQKPLWRNFTVLRTIGKGTHGTVVLARRQHDGAVVGLKQIEISTIPDLGRKQAENEVLLLKSLYHVNIVRFYDSFMEDNVLNIVMEYADGGNLRQLIKEQIRKNNSEKFPEHQVMSWFAQLVLAVAYMHGKNVLHRDLKSQNVFLTRNLVVKLGDFGISKSLAGDAMASTACGTPESMSPEICRGDAYGKKSDIWSLGCILYETIMLARPFEANTLPAMFAKICQGDYPPIHESHSREIRLLIQLMLQQDPAKRPSIEDICRFPFVQQPIQKFLTDHIAEFQEALEHEAKLHLPAETNTPLPTITRTSSTKDTAFVSAAAGIHAPPAPINAESDIPPTSQASMTDWRDDLGEKLRNIVQVGTRRAGFLTHHNNCVTAAELILPLKTDGKSHEESVKIITELVKANILNVVAAEHSIPQMDSPRTFLRFQLDEPDQPLNKAFICRSSQVPPAIEVGLTVRELMTVLHSKSQFPKLGNDHDYKSFLRVSAQLQRVHLANIAKQERQGFFINVYNTMVLHGFIVFGLPSTPDQYKQFEKAVSYQLGGIVFSLGDIRHGILRGNRKPPSNFWGKHLESADIKLKFMLHIRDPRNLLALIDSCAPIPCHEDLIVFKPGSTDTCLEDQAHRFCSQNIAIASREMTLPKLFKIYRDDFGASTSEMILWISQYMDNIPGDIAHYRIRYHESIAS